MAGTLTDAAELIFVPGNLSEERSAGRLLIGVSKANSLFLISIELQQQHIKQEKSNLRLQFQLHKGIIANA